MINNNYILLAIATFFFSIFIIPGCVNKLFYYPDQKLYLTPAKKNLSYEDVFFQSQDGTRLHGWFVKAAKPPVGTVIHFHGNAQNLTAHFSSVDWFPEMGFNVFTFDYRGYGKSQGAPNRRGVFEDCIAAISYIKTRPDVNPNNLFVFGQSLGGANAIAALGENRFSGIRAAAIESTFYSYRSIVRDKIAQIPILSLIRWPLSFLIVSNAHSPGPVVDRISPVPILFIHGTEENVIPYPHSEKLFEQAKEPKQLWIVKDGGHTEAFTKFGYQYKEQLVEFFIKAL